MWRVLRISVLLTILAVVGLTTWNSYLRTTQWTQTLRVMVYPVNAQGDVQLFGLHVLRLRRVGVGRRAQQQAGVGLDVPGFVDAADTRPVVHRQPRRRREDEG